MPNAAKSNDLYNKGIVDPYNLEIREAYVQLNGFLSKKTDLTIGRQQFAWGTVDKLNPTNNLNPYGLEDILDFGRKRGLRRLTYNIISTMISLCRVFLSSSFSRQTCR